MDLDALVRRFRGPLIGLFAASGANPHDARELAQDVFADAYLSRRRFVGEWDNLNAVGAWLRGIARNRWNNERRRAKRRPHLLDRVEQPDDICATPPELAERAERQATVRSAIDGLRESSRTVLYMHYIEGSGLAEIGALLETTERAVEGRLRRARAELTRALRHEPALSTRTGTGS